MRQDHVKRIFNWPVVPPFSELHWKYRFSSPLTSSACRRLIKIVRLISGQCSGHEGQRQHTVSRTTSEYIHFRVLYNDQQVTNITNFTRISTSSRDILPINILVRYHTCSLFDINRKILTKVEIIGSKKLQFLLSDWSWLLRSKRNLAISHSRYRLGAPVEKGEISLWLHYLHNAPKRHPL